MGRFVHLVRVDAEHGTVRRLGFGLFDPSTRSLCVLEPPPERGEGGVLWRVGDPGLEASLRALLDEWTRLACGPGEGAPIIEAHPAGELPDAPGVVRGPWYDVWLRWPGGHGRQGAGLAPLAG